MVRAVLEAEDAAAALEFVGSLRMTEGVSAALASLRTLLDVSVAQYRSERNASYAFNLLRNSAERAGIYVLLIGNLGNYRTNIATDSFRGFAIADRIAPFIVINDQDARPAWSFTLLHEAVHLLLGHTGVGNVRTDSAVERFCDDVAGEFLLPTDELNAVHWDSSDLNALSGQISDFADGKKSAAVWRHTKYIGQVALTGKPTRISMPPIGSNGGRKGNASARAIGNRKEARITIRFGAIVWGIASLTWPDR